MSSKPTPTAAGVSHPLTTLQLGMGWSDGKVGHGGDRYFAGLTHSLVSAGNPTRGLVVGAADVEEASGGVVHAVARESESFFRRRGAMHRAAKEFLTKEPHALVASHFAPYAGPLGMLGRRAPHVCHFHGPWAEESAAEGAGRLSVSIKRMIERRVYRTADRFITLSRAFSEVLVSRYGVDPQRVRVAPGGVDCNRFWSDLSRQTSRERLGLPTDRPLAVCVRRLGRRMGIESLIDAMAEVAREQPDAMLCIAGSGVLRETLEEQVDSLGLRGSVRFLGFVPDDDLPVLYRAADLSIVPSRSLEGFGLITIESLASGTPVFVTPVGGLPEAVSGLSPNLVLPAATAEAIAEGLVQAFSGTIPLPSSDECRSYARKGFDWPVVTQLVLAVYREAIAARA